MHNLKFLVENDKREKKKQKKHKIKENGDTATIVENIEIKVKKPKNKSHKKQEEISEPEQKQNKIKKRKNKDTSTENIDETPLKPPKNKSRKQKEDTADQEPETRITKKDKKRASVTFTPETIDNEPETNESPSKRQKSEETRLPTEEELLEVQKPQNIKDVASKRQKKRLKHEKLLADNKLKQDAALQEKALNYLSRWKHNQSEWKFEKLRQIWLQNHMFDVTALPDKFFDILVEYFGGSKGKIREVLIETCTKIVDEAEDNEDAVAGDKFKRARTLLQFLQE